MAATTQDRIAVAFRARVTGHVQGVGFRPFVKRLADELELSGGAGNDSSGVFLEVEGEQHRIDVFLARLRSEAPAASLVEAITVECTVVRARHGFEILPCPLESSGPRRARVPRDRAVCDACRDESADPTDRRYLYSFTACTTCGPRYTLLATLPYERGNTAMAGFPLCERCAREFGNTNDRRFHAEVMACPECGPRVVLHDPRTQVRLHDEQAVERAADALREGEIVALKGLGGYQLLVRADDSTAIARLRKRKQRPAKPLAVMVRSLVEASRHALLNPAERDLLASPENPIVPVRRRHDSSLDSGVAPHLDHVGLLLPTTPLHQRLLELVSFPVVATSGNRGEEPILADDATPADLAAIADVVLMHNRAIVRRLDDSVVRVIAGRQSVVRLARGYAPLPLTALERWLQRLGSDCPEGGVLALGGQQKNAVALWTGTQAVLGPHLGDLESGRTRTTWLSHLDDLAELYGTEIRMLVVDLHPDYAASRWAEQSGLPFVQVGHHHAHAAAAMVEHDLLDRTVLALTWDGTGLGPDGTLWGGECLRASLASFQRVATLRPLRLAGGEAAIRQPWRIAVALLRDAVGEMSESHWSDVSRESVRVVQQLLERQVQCPATTSMGRLFDGIASLLLGVSQVSYEGEVATWLESIADESVVDSYPVVVEQFDGIAVWDWRPMVSAVVSDRKQCVPKSVCAARFHNSVARWAQIVASSVPELDVVLTGGCFQNARLTNGVKANLESIGKRVHLPGLIPVNDGGLAAGQLVLGLARELAEKHRGTHSR